VLDDVDSLPHPDPEGDELRAAWRLVMELVLDQRWRWPEVAAELKISQAGLRALLAIDPDEPRPMRDLADAMNCDASYVTAMIDDLERAGYANRRPAPTDRRVKTIALTPAGRRALRTVQDELLAPPAQLTRLPAPQRDSLARLLRLAFAER
jgi:DNA-binding MarR family transcriptional regulator